LPDRPPEQFQFGIRQLLVFTLISAIVALGLRQIVLLVQKLPALQQSALLNTTICVFAVAALFYYFFRAPYLVLRAGSIRRRWKEIQEHRKSLNAWAKQRRDERKEPIMPSDIGDDLPHNP
jgi:hypothetical protein